MVRQQRELRGWVSKESAKNRDWYEHVAPISPIQKEVNVAAAKRSGWVGLLTKCEKPRLIWARSTSPSSHGKWLGRQQRCRPACKCMYTSGVFLFCERPWTNFDTYVSATERDWDEHQCSVWNSEAWAQECVLAPDLKRLTNVGSVIAFERLDVASDSHQLWTVRSRVVVQLSENNTLPTHLHHGVLSWMYANVSAHYRRRTGIEILCVFDAISLGIKIQIKKKITLQKCDPWRRCAVYIYIYI